MIRFKTEELEKIRQIIYRETGMLFEDKKNYFLENRLTERMKHLGLTDFREFLHVLIQPSSRQELDRFIESITINETYFFRDFEQLQGFAEQVLPVYLQQKRNDRDRDLRVWSAACSTGEEPYTLSIILQEVMPDLMDWNLRIDATDIDSQVLEFAAHGLYSERSLHSTPEPYIDRYFTQMAGHWRVKDRVQRPVQFKRLNFMDNLGMRGRRGFDFIFCRNVLIYFDDRSRRQVVEELYDALLPGGYLFLGHSESVGRITSIFQLERVEGFLCYKKPN
jgi:chemotaxis protein methyltransferase CheR